jgi:FkbH-like protein
MSSLAAHPNPLAALAEVIRPSTTWVVVHSSIAGLGPDIAQAKWELLHAVRALTARGLTLAFPAFTFSFCRGKPFDGAASASETGILADWVSGLNGAIRTAHPIYSFVACGPRALELAACRATTTFGDDSPFGFFEQNDAELVMLGCGWEYCTQFHRYEEAAQVPYRYLKEFRGQARGNDGTMHETSAAMFVRDLELDPVNDFSAAVRRLRQNSAIRSAALWRGRVEATSTGALAQIARELLAVDSWCFVTEPRRTSHRCRQLEQSRRSPALEVALLGHGNLDVLRQRCETVFRRLVPDRRIAIYTPPFGRMIAEIIDDNSALWQRRFDLVIVADRPEDWLNTPLIEAADPAALRAKGEAFVHAVLELLARHRGHSFVLTLAQLGPSPLGLSGQDAEVRRALREINDRLTSAVAAREQAHLFDLQHLATEFRGRFVVDDRLWALGRFPFSDEFSLHLAERFGGALLAALGQTVRVLALDLDNTLWGGVLGEDGKKNLALGGDHPGNAFLFFQQALLLLNNRGVVLALVSKNDEELAMDAIDSLPFMVLRASRFAARRINWRPKWQNLLEILDELGLAPEHVLFVDDNPVERAEMRRNLPQVNVLELPADPTQYTAALLRSPWLECLRQTAEDRNRARAYEKRSELLTARESFDDLESFYASLESRLHLLALTDDNLARAAQLQAKTNQFNTTTRRYRATDLEALRDAGHDVVVIGLEDRTSAFELIGLLVAKYGDPEPDWVSVDSYLLSCRVLGRGLESGALTWLMRRAASRGCRAIRGQIIETERNTPVRDIFASLGFHRGAVPNLWLRDLLAEDLPLPPWITLVNRT